MDLLNIGMSGAFILDSGFFPFYWLDDNILSIVLFSVRPSVPEHEKACDNR